MAFDSEDEWVITTKSTNQPNTNRTTPTTPTTLTNLWEESDKEATTIAHQQPRKRTPETFSRKSRNPSPSTYSNNRGTLLNQHTTYKPTLSAPHRNKTPSPTRFVSSSNTSIRANSSPSISSKYIPSPTQSYSWSNDDKRTNMDYQQGTTVLLGNDNSDILDVLPEPEQYVALLMTTYKNSDHFIASKEDNCTPYLLQPLADLLSSCSDPCTWIQGVLLEMDDYVTKHKKTSPHLTPKFQRLLVQAICRSLDMYLNELTLQDDHRLLNLDEPQAVPLQTKKQQPQQPQQQEQEQQYNHEVSDLIIFTDDEDEDEEPDLIDLSFDDEGGEGDGNGNGNGNDNDNDDDNDNEDDEDEDDDEDDTDTDDDVVVLDMSAVNTQHNSQQLSSTLRAFTLDSENALNDGDNDASVKQENDDDNTNSNTKDFDDITYPENTQQPLPPATLQHQETPPKHSLTKEHQIAFINMINKIDAPSITYYAMETFGVAHLLTVGAEYGSDGTTLCRKLLRQSFYKEAISCILRLHQQEYFPIAQMAEFMFNVGQGAMLLEYVGGKIGLQYSLLSFINVQLRYNFAGKLGVVDSDLLENVTKDTELIPPMQRMRERRFQKDLLNCAQKLVDKLDLTLDKYYFIWLSQRYAAIRWAVSARSAQQAAENDDSIEASSNYNGILELIADDTPTLAKLVIKELVDLRDMLGAHYFATQFKQEAFFVFYQSLLPTHRMLGVIRGEQISHSISSYHIKKQRHNNKEHLIDYVLPAGVQYKMVDDHVGILEMKLSLVQSKRCGLDSEWVPTMAKAGKEQTALLQIATDDGIVYLLDMKTLLKPTNHQLLARTELVLRKLFESRSCVKLAYDFSGDMSLLTQCMPGVKQWNIKNFRDMNKLKDYSVNKKGGHILGGLAGVVSTFLGVAMNKKQQLSNWEKRPLTTEQAVYAACDAFCLLEVYDILIQRGHEFAIEMTPPTIAKTIPTSFSILDSPLSSPVSPPVSPPTALRTDVPETSSSHADVNSMDLIQF